MPRGRLKSRTNHGLIGGECPKSTGTLSTAFVVQSEVGLRNNEWLLTFHHHYNHGLSDAFCLACSWWSSPNRNSFFKDWVKCPSLLIVQFEANSCSVGTLTQQALALLVIDPNFGGPWRVSLTSCHGLVASYQTGGVDESLSAQEHLDCHACLFARWRC